MLERPEVSCSTLIDCIFDALLIAHFKGILLNLISTPVYLKAIYLLFPDSSPPDVLLNEEGREAPARKSPSLRGPPVDQ